LCLDTFRVGAVEQLRLYAGLARLPLEVAWDAADAARALRRLGGCEVVLVDTAGRGPRERADHEAARDLLVTLAPHEVHVVVPAGLDTSHARRVVAAHAARGATHVLPTKLDECPDDPLVRLLAAEHGLAMRWLADGQQVPDALRAAGAPALAEVG
jgi:flagellar biosynthesis protein FlhF